MTYQYQPGDVVRLKDQDVYADGFIPWSGGDDPAPGKRVSYRLRNGDTFNSVQPHCLMWNHVPCATDIAAYKVIDDEQPANTAETQPDAQPHDYKVGDRVRITAEVTVCYVNLDSVYVSHPILSKPVALSHTELADLKPERLEPPLRVGDKVRTPVGDLGEIKAVDGGIAWVRCGKHYGNWSLISLERA